MTALSELLMVKTIVAVNNVDDHKVAVTHFWNRLKDRGFIKEGKHEGCYSVNEESFITPKDIVKENGKYYKEDTREELELIEERNYVFEITKELKEEIKQWI